MSKLTRAEKNAIIINEAKGILHPDYYVCQTKSGTMQVRKRKTPLNSQPKSGLASQPISDSNSQSEENSTHEQINIVEDKTVPQKPSIEYDMITNKQLLERMLSILEKNTENKNQNLNDPEREIISNENKKFVENIEEKVVLSEKLSQREINQTQNNVKQNDKNISEQLNKSKQIPKRRIRILN